ncbi:DUF899 family protein [Marilutibacter spongiae]|uniref:DUF899 family protein n=1 Tax=Marilutibacter spongiae TaxID=2025720 RepID=A0A7W3TNT1_9GAMM|nr:DUF899 family protein [Lysobacter spongiae]MBB1061596.1 DUF899 family protein [Lysobacter spongiae]
MSDQDRRVPAATLASKNESHFPNESDAYRSARNALLAEEIELRRHIWRVGEMRRALPPGGEVTTDYRFEGAHGAVGLDAMFGDKDTLIVYNMMYGPTRRRGCPMCTTLLSSWDPIVPHLEQRLALAVVARSPYPRIAAYGIERGWKHLKLYADPSGDFTRDFVGDRDADMPAYTVFHRDGATIRHFYSAEGSPAMADPGQDPHTAPDMNPLWILLDTTPGGRGTDWYPTLDDKTRP